MRNFKKLVAGAGIVALLVMNTLNVNGAALNGATSTYDDSTDSITVTVAKDFTSDNISVWSVKNSTGVTIDSGDSTDVTEANGSFVINSGDFDGLSADIYSVSFSTVSGDFGASVLYVGNANVVNVSAVVLPILSMALSTNTLDFGELEVGVPNSVNLDVTTASNAADGITVSVASTGLATGNTVNDYHIGDLARGSSNSTTGTSTYLIASTTNNGGDTLNENNVDTTNEVLDADNVTKANAVTNVELTVEIDAKTEAGNYSDVLTFTVTGRF